jgi:hypothetical protein
LKPLVPTLLSSLRPSIFKSIFKENCGLSDDADDEATQLTINFTTITAEYETVLEANYVTKIEEPNGEFYYNFTNIIPTCQYYENELNKLRLIKFLDDIIVEFYTENDPNGVQIARINPVGELSTVRPFTNEDKIIDFIIDISRVIN